MSDLGLAITIAANAHSGQKDKSGRPYILHCLHVMGEVEPYGEEHQIVAILHDTIEDTNITLSKLSVRNFSQEVLDALALLTHQDGVSYDAYIKGIGTNLIACRVKQADLRHNSDLTRLKGIRDKDIARAEKYHRSYVYLNECIANHTKI